MRRLRIVALLSAVLAVGIVSPAFAQDLEDWLERARRAEYTGRQFTLCDTPDGRRIEVVEVSQRDGLIEVTLSTGSAVVSDAGVYQRSPDGSMSVTTAETLTEWELADRYDVQFGSSDEVLNRPVDVLNVMDGDLVRLRLAFDRETGAVLRAEVHNNDASHYCTSGFLDFEASAEKISYPHMIAEVMNSAVVSDDRLPDGLAGFARKDAYDGPSGSLTAFYSDGIFSCTLVAADERINVEGSPETSAVFIGGSSYDRAFTAGQSIHSWVADVGGYVMLGDLPLDLQAAVLADLPEPERPNILTRFWRRLFW